MFLPKTLVLLAHVSKSMSALLQKLNKLSLDFVPLKTASGQRTALAEELAVELSPTLVVTHETLVCDIDGDTDEEFCDQFEESVERIVGANNIIKGLQSTLDAYTYAHTE